MSAAGWREKEEDQPIFRESSTDLPHEDCMKCEFRCPRCSNENFACEFASVWFSPLETRVGEAARDSVAFCDSLLGRLASIEQAHTARTPSNPARNLGSL